MKIPKIPLCNVRMKQSKNVFGFSKILKRKNEPKLVRRMSYFTRALFQAELEEMLEKKFAKISENARQKFFSTMAIEETPKTTEDGSKKSPSN